MEPNSSALDGQIQEGLHVMTVRVYYEDTDFSGVVYHANYLHFIERGRTNYLRLLGASQNKLFEGKENEGRACAFVVRSMNIEFYKPAVMDDLLEIITVPTEVKGASFILNQKVQRGKELLVEASVKIAFVSAGRVKPLPKELCALLKK
ncbi:MAG TPA: tol-pal system-associated acyl-CoA thioesterase [Parachlamydiaceae bacterium]|nr:tol-pal system-associated acyl-CoA thioesterase [Nitrosopumilus sp.]HEV8052122.1 tol-pal system-associated acyl-CoA thioesterase [Parachlamydiaceae bacterium]